MLVRTRWRSWEEECITSGVQKRYENPAWKVQDGIIIIDGYTHAQQMLSRFPW
jgi:hypothetical protein